MKILKLLICGCILSLIGCASSEPVKRSVDTDEIRENAAQAYEELDAEQVGN